MICVNSSKYQKIKSDDIFYQMQPTRGENHEYENDYNTSQMCGGGKEKSRKCDGGEKNEQRYFTY